MTSARLLCSPQIAGCESCACDFMCMVFQQGILNFIMSSQRCEPSYLCHLPDAP